MTIIFHGEKIDIFYEVSLIKFYFKLSSGGEGFFFHLVNNSVFNFKDLIRIQKGGATAIPPP